MASLEQVFQRLLDHFGPQRWWPADTPFEVMVGAVLTQNTSWNNVKPVLARLRDDELLSPAAMHRATEAEIAERIRSSGYYRQKSRRLKSLARFVMTRHGGSLEAMFSIDLGRLRSQLLSVHGIGPETADSILLYAGQKPAFVVDAYTARMMVRHQWIEPEADYHQIQSRFVESLPVDVALYNEFHALIVQLGKEFCRKQPICAGCPLEACLPPQGPRG